MSELEEKLGAVLSNPQLMQQIMSLAQTLGQPAPEESTKKQDPQQPAFDPHILQQLSGIARQGSVDQNQKALLHALSPYLSHERINKLERAMRAAQMAGAASAFLNAGGIQLLTGR